MKNYRTTLSTGIQPSPEFNKKGLAQFAINVGTKCGHDCLYCRTGSLLRMHRSFEAAGESPFGFGYSIVDPDTPERVAREASQMRNRGLIQLCTTVDAWAPEAQEHNLAPPPNCSNSSPPEVRKPMPPSLDCAPLPPGPLAIVARSWPPPATCTQPPARVSVSPHTIIQSTYLSLSAHLPSTGAELNAKMPAMVQRAHTASLNSSRGQ